MPISRRLLDVAHRLDGLRTGKQTAASSEPGIVPIESLGYASDEDVVPIESLAPDEPESDVVPIQALAPDEPAAAEAGGLEASFKTFELLIKQRPPATPSLDALLRRAPLSPAAAVAAIPEPMLAEVAIGTLCYSGQAALERAAALRHEINAALLSRNTSLESLQPLLRELLDLVPLALDRS
jgi:hypothetical protein